MLSERDESLLSRERDKLNKRGQFTYALAHANAGGVASLRGQDSQTPSCRCGSTDLKVAVRDICDLLEIRQIETVGYGRRGEKEKRSGKPAGVL